jgi:sirohydrochlorin cobaltochelatase
MKALILFEHGHRDARLREQFDRLANLYKAQHPYP